MEQATKFFPDISISSEVVDPFKSSLGVIQGDGPRESVLNTLT